MLVDQGAHPELLFGGEDEEQDKGYRVDDEWRESGESGRRTIQGKLLVRVDLI